MGFNEVELCMKGSGYNFIHAADMMYCADNHIRSESESLHHPSLASTWRRTIHRASFSSIQ